MSSLFWSVTFQVVSPGYLSVLISMMRFWPWHIVNDEDEEEYVDEDEEEYVDDDEEENDAVDDGLFDGTTDGSWVNATIEGDPVGSFDGNDILLSDSAVVVWLEFDGNIVWLIEVEDVRLDVWTIDGLLDEVPNPVDSILVGKLVDILDTVGTIDISLVGLSDLGFFVAVW